MLTKHCNNCSEVYSNSLNQLTVIFESIVCYVYSLINKLSKVIRIKAKNSLIFSLALDIRAIKLRSNYWLGKKL